VISHRHNFNRGSMVEYIWVSLGMVIARLGIRFGLYYLVF
jgi:hypothetical protein